MHEGVQCDAEWGAMGKRAQADGSGRPSGWRPSGLTWSIVVLAIGGMVAGLYPMTAAWVSSYNQSQVIRSADRALDAIVPGREEQLVAARMYNEALAAGVRLEAGGNVPVGTGNASGTDLRYEDLLVANDDGLMARIQVPGIGVDLPVYHGTSDKTLLRGAGHLEGSHLPVGGVGTRSVITAHRGLANSTMFSNLDRVRQGDTFVVEVMGEVLSYRVTEIEVIDPKETSSLRARPGKDLVTLITCTPLGVNSHRIVVTGERTTPTPPADLGRARQAPQIPGFPWWVVIGGGGVLVVGAYLVWQGRVDGRRASRHGQGPAGARDTNVTDR